MEKNGILPDAFDQNQKLGDEGFDDLDEAFESSPETIEPSESEAQPPTGDESYGTESVDDVISEETELAAESEQQIEDEESSQEKVDPLPDAPSEAEASVESEEEVDVSDEVSTKEDPVSESTQKAMPYFMPDEETFGTKKISKMSKKKKAATIVGIIAAVLLAGYAGGCAFFSGHFYNNATFNGTPVGNKSTQAVVEDLQNTADNYTLTLTKWNDEKVEIKGKDIAYEYKDEGEVQKALDTQAAWKWPMGLIGETAYKGKKTFKFDAKKLDAQIAKVTAVPEGQETVSNQNAHPVYENGAIVIKPESYGNTLDSEKTAQVISKAVSECEPKVDMKKAGCYGTPKYKAEDEAVKKAKTEMEKCLGSSLTYTIDDQTETLSVTVFGPWLTVDGDMNVTVDDDQASAYLSGLAAKYDIAGGPYSFTTTGGERITLNSGSYGWAIDEASELSQLKEDILSGKAVSREPASYGPSRRDGVTDISGTYVEVSIDSQTMWLYVDGSCVVSTPVVTGCISTGHGTHTGVYSIAYHSRNTHLKGFNDDGSEYDSFVQYWMPFNGGEGIHDADGWRGAYGGSIYIYGGSHGCVNTPTSAVATIFENTSDGCPVVVY